jgi:hypothetical protein
MSATVAVLAAAALVLSACSGGNTSAQQHPAADNGTGSVVQPVPTTEGDWRGTADVLGRPGKLKDGTIYRFSFPRSDLAVTSQNVRIKPALALGSYAAFARYPDGSSMVMGDLVVTEAELPAVTDALQRAGINQTAIHKHLLQESPPVWWTHIHGQGNPQDLARGIRAALDATGTPPPSDAQQPPPELDTGGIDAALGRKGTAEGGAYKFSVPRRDTISDSGMGLPPAMGVTTALNFQPTGGGRAAINGDVVMTANEVQPVLRALRQGGITVVSLHNHGLGDEPRLFYTHFWAEADAVTLAKALRTAVDATAVKPPK